MTDILQGSAVRQQILSFLKDRPEGASLSQIKTHTGKALSTVHHHVKKLSEAELVLHRPNTPKVFYNGNLEGLDKVLRLLEASVGIFDGASRWADAHQAIKQVKSAAEALRIHLKANP
jgi:DNA-binding transcriptional ArsR family regulator